MQGVRRTNKFIVVILSEYPKTVAAGVRRVKRTQHLEVVENCRKEYAENLFEFESVRKLRRDKTSKSVEEKHREFVHKVIE
jgi:hypothetical protein